ncbi:Ribonuclease H1 [Mycena chlorophos]|uniref:Ribonuclease H1 n=1 Tax=Mycena chlorophos TaxID=658473 RepID=A0A8H6TMA7_MYCCL|nr:Ribonuclease H1 [Mycena chlorophos]
MTKKLRTWEDQGWTGVKEQHVLRPLATALRARSGKTTFRVDDADASLAAAQRLANQACNGNQVSNADLTLDEDYHVPGVKLCGTKQKVFYKSIREKKNRKRKPRARTEKRIKQVTADVLRDFDRAVTPEEIWTSTKSKDISYNIPQLDGTTPPLIFLHLLEEHRAVVVIGGKVSVHLPVT